MVSVLLNKITQDCAVGDLCFSQETPNPNRFFLLFLGPSLGAEEAFDLYCHGPDFTSLMTCKYGNSTFDHCKYISREILQNEQICDFLMKSKESDMSVLAVRLFIMISLMFLFMMLELTFSACFSSYLDHICRLCFSASATTIDSYQ